jgi:nicotinamide phosphoribosyltransferase
MRVIPPLLCDFYKISHREQYPENTEMVYSTWIPRSGAHYPEIKEVVCYGIQGFILELTEVFDLHFFALDKETVLKEYARYIKFCLGVPEPYTKHIEALHDLGYLPLKIKALPEGTLVPFRVPMMTVQNTKPEFFWFTNFIETVASNLMWKPCTTASIAYIYRKLLDKNAIETTGSTAGVEFQGHDFSMRGMSGPEDAARSGAGHLLSFVGTDTIPAIQYIEQYYGGNIEEELIGCSVNASEHSVMCAGGFDTEFDTFKRLITEVYPTGIISIVSDTWDLWKVITDFLPRLKETILKRGEGIEGIHKVVIRPDSGDPVDILCGDPKADPDHPAYKGVVELLWDIFGGTVTEQGYKVLHPAIGAIYGDAITLDRCGRICERLRAKGFASTNVVFGIGSYTYQYITRDSLGFAMKATAVIINGVEQPIFKDPVTDDGIKKSARGRVSVVKVDGVLKCSDLDNPIEGEDLLEDIFCDGHMLKVEKFSAIRVRLAGAV